MAAEQEMTIGYEEVIAALENLDVKELAAILDRGSTLLKKALGKGPSKKKGTGIVPPQLEQNHEWVRFVLGDAKLNGWESFEMRTTKVDKSSGQKQVELVTMAGSVEKDGVHVFEDTEKEFTQKDAMSYAKCLKDRNDELYQRFMEDYSSQVGSKKEVTKTVKKTSEELEREKEEKKAAKEREKEEKKAEKEREKEEKKAEKEREKAAKEAEKAREKAEKEKEKKPEKKMLLVPVKRERSASPVPTTAATAATAAITPAKKIVVKKPVAPVKAPQEEEEEEEEDMIELDD